MFTALKCVAIPSFAAVALLVMPACEKEGHMEKAGEHVKDAAKETGKAAKETAQDAADATKRAANKAADAVEDAAQDAKDATK